MHSITLTDKRHNDNRKEIYMVLFSIVATSQATKGNGNIERRLLPIILNWTATIREVQGATLNRTVINLVKENFCIVRRS